MTPKELLALAREKIASPYQWLQVSDTCAENEYGNPVISVDPTAYRWCTFGALCAVSAGVHKDIFSQAVQLLQLGMQTNCIITYNKTHSHAQVMQGFDLAQQQELPVEEKRYL